ncbi:MAG TPA: HD domain-containing phosphohydrolase [Acidimicrobiales bacterium]
MTRRPWCSTSSLPPWSRSARRRCRRSHVLSGTWPTSRSRSPTVTPGAWLGWRSGPRSGSGWTAARSRGWSSQRTCTTWAASVCRIGCGRSPGALTTGEWEQVKLHSYHSERIMSSTPALAPIAQIVGMHHERLDGSGYHRACRSRDIDPAARVLAAADAYQAMTQDRPHRAALAPGEAADELLDEARAGRFDPDVAAAVLDEAGQPRAAPRATRAGGLSDREIEVLGLVAKGFSNPEIGRALGISRRTAEHHVQHIYTKTGVSTRAAAALFALEHDLLVDV